MRSHISLSLVCFFYATLHAGLCTRSNQTNKQNKTERPDKHSSQSTTLNAPPTRETKKIIPPDSALNPQTLERSPKPTSHHAPSYQTKVIATIDLTGEPEVARLDAKGPNEDTEAAKVYSALKQNICNRPPPPQNVRLTDELLHQVAKAYSAPSDLRRKVFGMNTFFYKALSEGGYQKVRKWYKEEDLCAYDIILIPIYIPGHWCLAVVDFRSKSIGYYDSLGGENMACLSALLDYLLAPYLLR